MDPNAALAEIRSIVARAGAGLDFDDVLLVELISSLDTWLSGGGFKPSDWA